MISSALSPLPDDAISKKRSQNRRRSVSRSICVRTRPRHLPAAAASLPRLAGSSDSILARMRRARTGAAPPEDTATTTGSRLTIAGVMNEEFARLSTDDRDLDYLLSGEAGNRQAGDES